MIFKYSVILTRSGVKGDSPPSPSVNALQDYELSKNVLATGLYNSG